MPCSFKYSTYFHTDIFTLFVYKMKSKILISSHTERLGFNPDVRTSKMIQMDGLIAKVANNSLQICEEEKKQI